MKTKWYKNVYIIILIIFGIWMIFFDTNSLVNHHDVNKEKNKLEEQKDYYKTQINQDKEAYQELNSDEGLETFAREKYYMKKENEDIYIIEYEDSLKTNNNE
ncbi:septum formation initiator family protein [Olleya sp. YS]|uniref:FtsB family cell division protein n=1 Tax=Olleya sp. YS TaxID=3028318 RepID=UPI00243446F3|nr:septum formation initiator family protein [Olleya sp. YS]WGD35053.1 septum formation initiator family protein [Olleya sp. YS]